MLEVRRLRAGYGASPVLFGVDLAVAAGEVVALLGRNGMGKTTTIRAVMGLLPVTAGTVRIAGADATGLPAHRIARLGLGLVPEGRGIFPNLTVKENLLATARAAPDRSRPWPLARVLALFPRLAERAGSMGGHLSGGEQQMLAIGRALMTSPRLLILDEATEGLAPLARDEIWACLARLRAEEGQAVLVVDKHVERLLVLADRHVIVEKGRTVWQGTTAEFRAEPRLKERFLGI